MVQLIVLDAEFRQLAVIEHFSGLIWRRGYYRTGSFELFGAGDIFSALREGRYLHRRDLGETAIIEQYGYERETGSDTVYARGRMLKAILGDRVITSQKTFSGTEEGVMRDLVQTFAVSPSKQSRTIAKLTLGSAAGLGSIGTFQAYGENLLDKIEEITLAAQLSADVRYDYERDELRFEVWQGKDRTEAQSENTRAVFSDEFENISTQSYERSTADYRNVAYVSGSDSGFESIVEEVDCSGGGPRREIWLHAGRIKEAGQELTAALYRSALRQKGLEKLAEFADCETMEAVICNTKNIIYRQDFDLGDLCSYVSAATGIVTEQRITEILEEYEDNSVRISVVLGTDRLPIMQKIKRGLL